MRGEGNEEIKEEKRASFIKIPERTETGQGLTLARDYGSAATKPRIGWSQSVNSSTSSRYVTFFTFSHR
jgi:hypothetical protein